MDPRWPGYGSRGLSLRHRRKSLRPIPDWSETVEVLRSPDAPTVSSSAAEPSVFPPDTVGKSAGDCNGDFGTGRRRDKLGSRRGLGRKQRSRETANTGEKPVQTSDS